MKNNNFHVTTDKNTKGVKHYLNYAIKCWAGGFTDGLEKTVRVTHEHVYIYKHILYKDVC